MRFKYLILCLLLQAIVIHSQVNPEQLPLNTKVDDFLSELSPRSYFEVKLTEIFVEEDLIVVVRGFQPFDDPEVRLAFQLEDLFSRGDKVDKVYTCATVGREICIIPEKDLLPFKRLAEPKKIYIEVTQRGSEKKMVFDIQANYLQRQEYQFGKVYQLNQKQLTQEYTLKFNDTLKENETINRIFASLIPLNKELAEEKIEFYAFVQQNEGDKLERKYDNIQKNLNNNLKLKKKSQQVLRFGILVLKSKLSFSIIANPNQTYEFRTESPQHEGKMDISEKYYGSLFEGESYTYKLSLANVLDLKEKDLVLKVHPYFGKALIEINANRTFNEAGAADWSYEVWSEERIILLAKERVKVNAQDEIYYIRVTAKQELSYSIRSTVTGYKDKLSIDAHETVVGYNDKNSITNYLFKTVPKNTTEVRIMLLNLQGDNDVFIKQCNFLSLDACLVTADDINQYEQEISSNGKSEVFILAKRGDHKREFFEFYANPNKCKSRESQECRFMIGLKGMDSAQNKYLMRTITDAEHVQLKNNVPFKDKVLKYDFNFYKFQSPPLSNIEQIDFIVTTFVGHVVVRASRTNQFPKRTDFEQITKNQNNIHFNVTKYPDISDKSFYISVQGELDSIYTITPHLIFKSDSSEANPGILIMEGMKQDIILTQNKTQQYFYIKVPYMVENDGNPKITLSIQPSTEAYKICMDVNQSVLLKDSDKAQFKNKDINNQVEISSKQFNTETILFGVVEPLKKFVDANENKQITVYYNTEFSQVELEINKSSSQYFKKKIPNYYVFSIKEYSNYFISVITKALEAQSLVFFISLNQNLKRPTSFVNTGKFTSYEGFDIEKSLIDQYCPFISTEKSNIDQTCYVYITGTSNLDASCSVTVSNEGAINHLYEGVHFKTKIPNPNQFSYFVHDIQPGIEHTSIQLISSQVSHLQIYALIYFSDETDQSTLIKKSHFPTSQISQFQSTTDVFNQGTSILQIHTFDNEKCRKSVCKVLITVDNLDKKFIRNKDSTMSLIVTNPNTILEIHEGKDYDVPRDKYEIKYFKYYVGDYVRSLKVELLGIPKFIEEEQYYTFNQIMIANNTSGLPINVKEIQVDIMNNMLEVIPENDEQYLKTGQNLNNLNKYLYSLYYIGIILEYTETPVTLRLTINLNHMIFVTPDGIQRNAFIDPQYPLYIVVDGIESKKIGSELVFLNSLSSDIEIVGYANIKESMKITGLKQIVEVESDNKKVGQKQGSYLFNLPQPIKDQHQILIKITAKKYQSIKFIYRDKSSLTQIHLGEYLKDVLLSENYRVFQTELDSCVFKLTLFSGEISVGLLNQKDISQIDSKKNLYELTKLEYSPTNSQKNYYEINLQMKSQNQKSYFIMIQNNHKTKDALYFIELTNQKSKTHATQVLKLNHPRSGVLSTGDNVQFAIENTALVKIQQRLSIFFPTLHLLENLGDKIKLPEVIITPDKNNPKFEITNNKNSSTQIYYELNLDPGKYFINITRKNDDLNLATIENDYKNILQYSISLDSFNLQYITDNVKYYQKSESRTQLGLFEYFRQWGTPFVVEVFDCLGDTSLALSESLETVKGFSSDLIVRSKDFGHYKYYTFSSFEEKSQIEKDSNNLIEDEDDDKEENDGEYSDLHSILYISSKSRSFDPQIKKAEYIIRISTFETNNQALMLPFEYFYLKQDKILVQETTTSNGKAFKFSSANIRCENQCSHIRAKVNYVTYELYIATMQSALQEYSVCHTNMTNYKDLSITSFPEAKSQTQGKLLLRKALKSNGFAKKDDPQSSFIVSLKEIPETPQQIYYTIIATVNIQEFGSQKAQNIPIFYSQQKLSGKWWEKCQECEIMKEDKGFLDKDNKTIEEETVEKEESSSSSDFSPLFIIFIILLIIFVLIILYKVFIHCRNQGKYSLKNILSTSSYELNDYQSYGN